MLNSIVAVKCSTLNQTYSKVSWMRPVASLEGALILLLICNDF